MPKVEIYTSMMCGYCTRAKALLMQKNVSFQEFDVGMDPNLRKEMASRSNGEYSVPQIFIDEVHVGGCDDLYSLERKGKLDQLLKL